MTHIIESTPCMSHILTEKYSWPGRYMEKALGHQTSPVHQCQVLSVSLSAFFLLPLWYIFTEAFFKLAEEREGKAWNGNPSPPSTVDRKFILLSYFHIWVAVN